MSLALRVRELREARGESLQQAADAVGISKGHLWQIERGKAQGPAIGVVTALASHYGTTVGFLLGEDMAAGDPELAGMFRDAQTFTPTEREILRDMMAALKRASAARQDEEQ